VPSATIIFLSPGLKTTVYVLWGESVSASSNPFFEIK
jgi:hypothetical protein